MARRDTSPDFIEALARGLDVIRAFQPHQPVMSLTVVAAAAGLARPTARRVLLTLEQLGYVRSAGGVSSSPPRVLDRFSAMPTSLGRVLLAALPPGAAEQVLAEPSRSPITARWRPGPDERAAELREVRARGWSLTDEQLAAGIRSVAAPLRDGDGRVIAALNVTVHAAETRCRPSPANISRSCSRRPVRSVRTGHATSRHRTSPPRSRAP